MTTGQPIYINPDFAKLWAGKTVSAFGSVVTRTALDLAAVITLGATPAQLGLLGALGRMPALLVGLPAGVWVDRLRRRPIMIVADLARAALLLTIPGAALLGVLSLPLVALTAFLTGALTVFFEVADNSYLPTVVSREHLVEGNSKLGVSDSLAEIGGPAIGGVLVQLVTAPMAILVDAASFIVSAAMLGLIRQEESAPAHRHHASSMREEIVEGLQTVVGEPILRALAAAAVTFSLLGGFFGALYSVYAIRSLELTPALLGLAIAGGGIGALAGAALNSRIVLWAGFGRTLIGGLLLHGICALVVPLARPPATAAAPTLFAAQVAGDAGLMLFFINAISLRQSVTPDRLLGRVNASVDFLVAAAGPVGLLLGGFLGQAIGMRPTLFLGAMGSFLGALWLFLSPVRTLGVQPVIQP
jgi:MFS family permease